MTNNNRNASNGLVGGIAVLFIFLLIGYGLYTVLPVLIALTANILSLVVGFLIIAAVLFILLHPRTRFGIGSLINSIFRK